MKGVLYESGDGWCLLWIKFVNVLHQIDEKGSCILQGGKDHLAEAWAKAEKIWNKPRSILTRLRRISLGRRRFHLSCDKEVKIRT